MKKGNISKVCVEVSVKWYKLIGWLEPSLVGDPPIVRDHILRERIMYLVKYPVSKEPIGCLQLFQCAVYECILGKVRVVYT